MRNPALLALILAAAAVGLHAGNDEAREFLGEGKIRSGRGPDIDLEGSWVTLVNDMQRQMGTLCSAKLGSANISVFGGFPKGANPRDMKNKFEDVPKPSATVRTYEELTAFLDTLLINPSDCTFRYNGTSDSPRQGLRTNTLISMSTSDPLKGAARDIEANLEVSKPQGISFSSDGMNVAGARASVTRWDPTNPPERETKMSLGRSQMESPFIRSTIENFTVTFVPGPKAMVNGSPVKTLEELKAAVEKGIKSKSGTKLIKIKGRGMVGSTYVLETIEI